MNEENETPERRRERLLQKESKRNPTGNLKDAFNRANSGSIVDLGWKETGILIIVVIVGLVIKSIFFN